MKSYPGRFSLQWLLLMFIILLLLPPVFMGTATALTIQARERKIQQFQIDANDIDISLNKNTIAPFYLSPTSEDPCNPDTISKIILPPGWSISFTFVGTDTLCQWLYFNQGQLIAKDSWLDIDRTLAKREYYEGGNLFAMDEFNLGRVECVKHRIYVNEEIISECYSEAGQLLTIDQGLSPSPLPPMFYWFFYR